jgi:predicted dehydrogenase
MTGVAVVGAGHWGPHLIRNFKDHPRSDVLWVIDTDPERLKSVGSRFRDVSLSSSLADALDDDRVDAVVVATPTNTHFDVVMEALNHGKHVLVEKPLTSTVETAKQACETAENKGLVLMVGHVFLFNPAIRSAKEYIDKGELGPVHYVSMTRTNLGPVRVDVNAAWDLASHDVAIANFWLGSEPVAVSATGGSWLNQGVHDTVFATMHYPNNILVHIEASWLSPRKDRYLAVIGAERMLTVDDMDLTEPLRLYDKGVLDASISEITDTFAGFRSQIREGTITIPPVKLGEPLKTECDAFLSRITGDGDLISDGWAGLAVVRVLKAIDRSVQEGGARVSVPGRQA